MPPGFEIALSVITMPTPTDFETLRVKLNGAKMSKRVMRPRFLAIMERLREKRRRARIAVEQAKSAKQIANIDDNTPDGPQLIEAAALARVTRDRAREKKL